MDNEPRQIQPIHLRNIASAFQGGMLGAKISIRLLHVQMSVLTIRLTEHALFRENSIALSGHILMIGNPCKLAYPLKLRNKTNPNQVR